MYIKVTEAYGHIYSDQTCQFPVQSSCRYKYILISYDVDSNTIISRPLKTKEGREIIDNLLKVMTLLISQGYHSKLFRLDNEITKKLKTLLCLASIDFQLVPPHCHRRNAAECPIQT